MDLKKLVMVATTGAALMLSSDIIFKEDFNVFQGKGPANWKTLVTSSDVAVAFIRGKEGFRMISPSNMFMPITDPVQDGQVDCTIAAYSFDPKCNYGFNVNFRQDVTKRQAQSIRFFNAPSTNKLVISYGTYTDNFFRARESKEIEVAGDVFSKPCNVSVAFLGKQVTATFNGKTVAFDNIPEGIGQISINRLNFFDSLELTRFEIRGDEKVHISNEKSFRIKMPAEILEDPYFCDVVLSEHDSFFEAKLTLSGGSHLTHAGEGNYHSMRVEKMDHPYFKVITPEKTIEYNLLDEAMMLFIKEIAPHQVYNVLYKLPEWPFNRTIRFAKPQGDFNLAVGAHEMISRVFYDISMKDWETVFTRDGQELYAGSSAESQVTAHLLSSPNKKIVSRLPKDTPYYERAVAFAQKNHYLYEDEKLDFTLQLQGAMLPNQVEITFANAFLKPIKTLDITPVETESKLGVRKQLTRNYSFTLPKQEVGLYNILLKSLDETVPLDTYFTFEVMPEDASKPTAAQASGLPYMYSARTETRGLKTDIFDPFQPAERNFSHIMSGTVFLPWYARQANLYNTIHLYGRKYFAWLGSRCLDHWQINENRDILKEADFAHFGVELEIGTVIQLYNGRKLRDFIEFAKKTGDPNYDIKKLEALLDGSVVKDKEDLRSMNNASLDPETYRYTVVHHFPEWLDFENEKAAQVVHNKLAELRKDNPKLKFACYGPAPIYTGRYVGPEFVRYMAASKFNRDDVGYLQYEDYPELCNYPESRGSFFLGTLSMAYPNIPIAAEMYGDGFGAGCPDGAVFFAHPPYGVGGNNYFYRTRNRVYEYTYATAYLDEGGYHYWERFGLQFSNARRERLENFLKAWGNTMENLPVKPLRSAAYVFSNDSWNANQSGDAHFAAKAVEGNDVPWVLEAAKVRKTAGEMMPFIYEATSNGGLCAGFQLMAENLKHLKATDCDILVLPPLKGVPSDQQAEIRRLYNEGVSIVCSEETGELADIFKVKDSGKFTKINTARGTGNFLPGIVDYTTDVCFGGHHVANGADILIEGDEAPVLFRASNGKANAYFFNVPPTTATSDMLWERHSYGREIISELMLGAVREIFARENKVEVSASIGRVLAAETKDGFVITHTNNTDQDQIVELTFHKRNPSNKLVSFDRPYQILQNDDNTLKIRFNTIFRSSAFLVIK